MAPTECAVLVPMGESIHPDCEHSLHVLQSRGYAVRRVRGFSQIDVGRSVMASDALAEGFQEILWIDSDIAFKPDDVEKLRAHPLPLLCGVYAKKGRREFACEFLPETEKVVFGKQGGLLEIRYAGGGFLLTRRAVYEAMQQLPDLPVCNERFGTPIRPYFLPLVVPDGAGSWYLGEDYAFCERARRCGFKVMADTSIRLWHVGTYHYGWEDAGSVKERYATYQYHITGRPGKASGEAPDAADAPQAYPRFTQDWLSHNLPIWQRFLAPLRDRKLAVLEVGVFEGRSTRWLLENVLTHPESTLTYIDTFEGGADQAGLDLAGLEERFLHNVQEFRAKLRGYKGRSAEKLRELSFDQFDFIYIDGSHEAPDVLSDAVLCWPLLKVGGLLAFDDYQWRGFPEPERCPQVAIDSFLAMMPGRYEMLQKGYQVWVRKLR